MQRLLVLAFASLIASAVSAENPRFHLNEQMEKEVGYSQAIRAGDTLYISGAVGRGEMNVAITQAYDALAKTLAAHGLGFADVVKETVFATNLDSFIANKDVRKRYYGMQYPAATWVQVERLYVPEFVVEVELIAVFPRN